MSLIDEPNCADPVPAKDRGGRIVRDDGGDPACWLTWTCPECGAFVGADPPENCSRCGDRLI